MKMNPCDEQCRICSSSFVGGDGEELVGTKLVCEESGCLRRFSLLCLLRSSGIDFPIRWRSDSAYSVSPESFISLELLRKSLFVLAGQSFVKIRCAGCAQMAKPISVAASTMGRELSRSIISESLSISEPPAESPPATQQSTDTSSKLDLLASNLCEIKKVVTVNSVTLSRMARQSPYRLVKKSSQAPVTSKAQPPEPRETNQQKNSVYICRMMRSDNHEDILEAINCSNVEVETAEPLSNSVLRLNLSSPLAKRQVLSQTSLLKGHSRYGHVFIRDECSKSSRANRELWKAMLFESRRRDEPIPAAVVFDGRRKEYRLLPKSPCGKLQWKDDFRPSQVHLERARDLLEAKARPPSSLSSTSGESEFSHSSDSIYSSPRSDSHRSKTRLQRGRPQVNRR